MSWNRSCCQFTCFFVCLFVFLKQNVQKNKPQTYVCQQWRSIEEGLTWSILLMATASWVTPRERTNRACSLVWPPASKPASNSPRLASTTSRATSAWTENQRGTLETSARTDSDQSAGLLSFHLSNSANHKLKYRKGVLQVILILLCATEVSSIPAEAFACSRNPLVSTGWGWVEGQSYGDKKNDNEASKQRQTNTPKPAKTPQDTNTQNRKSSFKSGRQVWQTEALLESGRHSLKDARVYLEKIIYWFLSKNV